MPKNVLDDFIKQYEGKYKHTAMVRHKGVVIAFAMDDQRRIFYSLLDFSGGDPGSTGAPKSALDKDAWLPAPEALIFPAEIAEIGFGVADQTRMQAFKKGSDKAEASDVALPPPDSAESKAFDYFRSTTARLGADAPFQALSDGQYVYIFRQAIGAGHASMVLKNTVPLVNSTLLVDRFVLASSKLAPKMEVRFQRSRSKTRPASRKDSLDAKDMDGNFFFEPTQELKFAGNLRDGRFAVLLLPTQVAEVQRWQIFAENSRTGMMDSFNVERAADGLFNTRGSQTYTCVDHPEVFERKEGKCVEPSLADRSQPCDKPLVPRILTRGFAESALEFKNATDSVGIPATDAADVKAGKTVKLGASFTLEAWIKPNFPNSTSPRVLLAGDGGVKLSILDNAKLLITFDGAKSFTTKPILTKAEPLEWHHVAVTFEDRDADRCRVYLDGRLREETMELNGGKSAGASLTSFGTGFNGAIDEIRVWDRVRSAREMRADMNQRLTGLEPDLKAYWRLDEASGATAFDQTGNGANGTITGAAWAASGAPIGEHPGIERCSFSIAGRSLQSGPAALLYYQQTSAGDRKPLKQSGRVMLAVAANDGSAANAGKNHIAALDLGVSSSGRLPRMPDVLTLSALATGTANNQSVNDLLDEIASLQTQFRGLDDDAARLNRAIDTLGPALAEPPIITPTIADNDLAGLNDQLREFQKAIEDLAKAMSEEKRFNASVDAATATLFEHFGFSGASLTYTRQFNQGDGATTGFVGFTELNKKNFNDKISSIQIDGPLRVTAFKGANAQDGSTVFTGAGSDVPAGFNDEISSLFIEENPDSRAPVSARVQTAQAARAAAKEKLARSLAALQSQMAETVRLRNAVKTQLDGKQSQAASGASATMPLVHADPSGLTISGGMLEFAWTDSAPLLFDSAAGSLALYFRGKQDQFFSAYYDTRTERARYELKTSEAKTCAMFIARSMDAGMDKLTVAVSGDDASACTVTITGPGAGGIVETWRNVPRNPIAFADVLNGLAGQHTFFGRAKAETAQTAQGTQTFKLKITDRTASAGAIPAGATILIGDTRMVLRQALPVSATELAITGEEAGRIGDQKMPLFFIGYDYAANATANRISADLSEGSTLVFAAPSQPAAQGGVANTAAPITSGSTLVCKWTADAPGSTLEFDRDGQCAQLAAPGDAAALKKFNADLKKFNAEGNLTMESWVRASRVTDNTRLIHHRSDASSYTLGLEKRDLRTALAFDGKADFVRIPNKDEINFDTNQNFTVEAWIKADPAQLDKTFGDNDIIEKWSEADGYPFVIRYANQTGSILAARSDGGPNPSITSTRKVNDGLFHHVAFVKEGAQLRLFIDGIADGSGTDTTIASTRNSSPLFLGCRGGTRNRFKGELDEVRIWKRARTEAEIQADMHRRLGGGETDLVGYWHFDGGAITDFSRNLNHGAATGQPKQTLSPLPAYTVFAGVNDQVVQSKRVIPAGNWTHLAAAYDQAYGLQFDGGNHLDCGNDATLDISRDLTVEVFLNVSEFGDGMGLVSRGRINDGSTDHDVPYALYLGSDGRVRFAFEDVEHKLHITQTADKPDWIQSTAALSPGFHKIAVTRNRQSTQTEVKDAAGNVTGANVVAWDDIAFYIDGAASGTYKYESAQAASVNNRQPVDAGSSNQRLEIGKGFAGNTITITKTVANEDEHTKLVTEEFPLNIGGFKGTITEVRVWAVARDTAQIAKQIKGAEKGLVSWWRFEEGSGKTAFDSKSQNHAAIHGAKWINSPDPDGSSLTLYIDGERNDPADTGAVTTHPLGTTANQFTLGALRNANARFTESLVGEMEETRVWKTTRTAEQIQDNLFRSLVERKARGAGAAQLIVEEQEDLIAYYTFDANAADRAQLDDLSLNANHLAVTPSPALVQSATPAPSYVISTAPISGDAPQVRGALAGVRNLFHGLIGSTPAVQEYADMQTDSRGNPIGVFKRCYSFIRDGRWNLITGYKVGDMTTEWIGQVQFAPELIGYIEGAPPVPSENLTSRAVEGIGDVDDYNQASFVELVEAEETTYSYASSRDKGFDMTVDGFFGLGPAADISVGIGLHKKVFEIAGVVGLKASFEHSQGWLEDAGTSVGRTTGKSTSLELRGRFSTPEEIDRQLFERRFLPDNVGQALVKSETADVFALRLRRNGALISYQMRPNPDIPKDWNIISFPINPRYVKQGTLDGKVGLKPDADYPNALTYSPDSSYFKPIEAYALKNRINRAEADLRAYFDQYAAGSLGRRTEGSLGVADRLLEQLPHLHKRNLVNTYVWTADGGLFAETLETMDSQQETIGGSYAFKGMAGLFVDWETNVGVVGIRFGIDALFGGHLNLSVTKTRESKSSFALNVNLDKVERDIYKRAADREIEIDFSDPQRPKPKKTPGKVDAYRFLSFYLEPESDHHDAFYARVVDPIWLAQSDDPGAAALRGAAQAAKKPPCWRVLHRVTYVSRVLPSLDLTAPPSLERTMQTLDIDSNFELIKLLEPFVAGKLSSVAEFNSAVEETLARLLPELVPHTAEIKSYLSHYFGGAGSPEAAGIAAPDDPFSQLERAANQPPIVNAGPDFTDAGALRLEGRPVKQPLDGAAISDDRLTAPESFFVTWEKRSGNGPVTFDDAHLLHAEAGFSERGRYVLKLTASDGQLSASDEMTVVVNEAPTIAILPLEAPKLQADGTWRLDLKAEIDTGLGDPADVARFAAPVWAVIGGIAGNVTIPKPAITVLEQGKSRINVLVQGLTFTKRGSYLFRLRAGDGSFQRDAQVMIAIAARVTDGLQALYTFQEPDGAIVHDVSGAGDAPETLDLTIANPLAANHFTGGLELHSPAIVKTAGAATRLAQAIKSSNEITIEAWIKSKNATEEGLARIVTLSGGPGARNFTLGQAGGRYYAALRSTATNDNASDRAMDAGAVTPNTLTHVACTRDKAGVMRFYVNGSEVARRALGGSFTNWNDGFALALGNEIEASGAGDGRDRAWLGEYHLIAVYSRALSADEVKQNAEFPANDNLPPIVSAGSDAAIEAVQSIRLPGRVTHDRGEAVRFEWSQASGPGGVTFATPNNPASNAETIVTFNLPVQSGRYLFRLIAGDGELTASDDVVVVVQAPAIRRTLALTDGPNRAAAIEDLGELVKNEMSLKAGGLSLEWSQNGGPRLEAFNGTETLPLNTRIGFSQIGLYRLTLTAKKNGRLWNSIPVEITVNQRPVVSAGSDRIITLSSGQTQLQTTLTGAVDTGLGNPRDPRTIKWTPVSGPAGKAAQIADDAQPITGVTFPANGVYVLRLTAVIPVNRALLMAAPVAGESLVDESLTGSRDVKFTINRLPVVDLGPDPALPIVLPDRAQLAAVVSDDGLPESPGAVMLRWSKASGPGDVTFGNDIADITTAEFSRKGIYELELTARDGAVSDSGTPLSVSDRQRFVVHSTPIVKVKADTVPAATVRPGAPPTLNVTRSQQVRVFVDVEDNGLGDTPQGGLTVEWTVSPTGAAIVDSTALDTRVSFTLTGLFTFQALVSNGFLSVTKTVQVQVNAS